MQVTMSNQKSTEFAIKNLEIQVGQLAKQLAENSSSTFGANTKKNPKEECKVMMTRGRKAIMIEDEERIVDDNQELVVERVYIKKVLYEPQVCVGEKQKKSLNVNRV